MDLKYTLHFSANGKKQKISSAEKELENKLIKISVSDDGERRIVTVTAKTDIFLEGYREFDIPHDKADVGYNDKKGNLYFLNGYQSWTDSREFYCGEREKDVMRLPSALVKAFAFDRYGDATSFKYDKDILHGYDVLYGKGSKEIFVLNANVKNAYLIFEIERKSEIINLYSDIFGKELAVGESFTVIDYYYGGSFEDGEKLLDKVYPKKQTKKLFGYTSWYNYYQDINESIILRDLDALDDRFELFQIDDGYETKIGDWLSVDEKKFPNGLQPIVDKVHSRGFMAGIWLAPFVAEEESELFKFHPTWFKKGEDGNPVKCGSNWSGFYALDLENKQVLEYIEKCLKHYVDMGFDFFKLDFLYAANLPSYKGKTNSMAAEYAYSFLRNVLGDKIILGCGATVFNCSDKFDYLRIGPDVSLKFDDVWYMKYMHRERISTKVTLQNSIYRSMLGGRLFGNDPDVFLLRDENIELSDEQKKSLITINALFGHLLMTSDDVALYGEKQKDVLDYALDLFRNAEVTGFTRRGDIITVSYVIRGHHKTLNYDTRRGILS
ncbi:MAG: alpha-galactosidase [Clostridia bacterium]|nr:alpha-galactosidase [Clostridia bacterium]